MIVDFSYCNAVPFLMPDIDTSEPKLVDQVYHVLKEYSCRLLSFAIGDIASSRIGKSKLLNDVLATEFETTKSSHLSHGTIDIDLGSSFNPDRKISVADAHGTFDLNAHMLKFFDVLMIHIDGNELQI